MNYEVGNGKWEVGSGKGEMGSGKWEVGSGKGKWEVGSRNWEVGSGKWEVGSGKWEVGMMNFLKYGCFCSKNCWKIFKLIDKWISLYCDIHTDIGNLFPVSRHNSEVAQVKTIKSIKDQSGVKL